MVLWGRCWGQRWMLLRMVLVCCFDAAATSTLLLLLPRYCCLATSSVSTLLLLPQRCCLAAVATKLLLPHFQRWLLLPLLLPQSTQSSRERSGCVWLPDDLPPRSSAVDKTSKYDLPAHNPSLLSQALLSISTFTAYASGSMWCTDEIWVITTPFLWSPTADPTRSERGLTNRETSQKITTPGTQLDRKYRQIGRAHV